MRPYMTEEEAREKWCPMARFTEDGFNNRDNSADSDSRCIGSGCMWWGWMMREGKSEQGVPNPYLDEKQGRCEAPGGAA